MNIQEYNRKILFLNKRAVVQNNQPSHNFSAEEIIESLERQEMARNSMPQFYQMQKMYPSHIQLSSTYRNSAETSQPPIPEGMATTIPSDEIQEPRKTKK